MKVFEFDGELMEVSIEEFVEMNQFNSEEAEELLNMDVGDEFHFPIGGVMSVLQRIE